MSVSRNDIYVRPEKGPDWLNDFFDNIIKQSGDIEADLERKKNGETVASVVEGYRKQVGLDLANDNEPMNIKTASKKQYLSIRQAQMEDATVIEIIEGDPDLKTALNSLLEHSGGTKKITSLIKFLRDRLGKEKVSYSDQALRDYLSDLKGKYIIEPEPEKPEIAGLIGVENHDDGPDTAEYYASGQNE